MAPVLDEAVLGKDFDVRPDALAALRAVVDVIAPGIGGLDRASERGVHLRLAQCLELAQRGSTTLLARMLDMYARTVRPSARFVELVPDEQDQVLRAIAAEDLDELRDLIDGVHVYTLNGYVTEWRRDGELRRPPVWEVMGYHGPAAAHRWSDA